MLPEKLQPHPAVSGGMKCNPGEFLDKYGGKKLKGNFLVFHEKYGNHVVGPRFHPHLCSE